MKKFLKLLDNLDSYIASVALSIAIVLLSIQVFFRYVLNTGISWNEEVSRFAYVWFVYLGVSMAIRSREHVRVTVHLKYLFPGQTDKILLFADFLWLCFSAILFWESIKFIESMFRFKYISPALGISMVWVYMIIPLVFLLMIIRLIQVHYLSFKKGERTGVVPHEDTRVGL